jgi:hypothetical protein
MERRTASTVRDEDESQTLGSLLLVRMVRPWSIQQQMEI